MIATDPQHLKSAGSPAYFCGVELPALQARRATLEDLPLLQTLWQRLGLPWEQLERYLTEFQVVTGGDGSIRAAIGLLVEGTEALVHTEAVADPEDANDCRDALWRRLQIVARNQGVARLWTQEDAAFWTAAGFVSAAPAQLESLRASFADPQAPWRIFEFVNPSAAKLITQQLAIWDASRAGEREDLQGRIRPLRNLAFALAGLVIVALIGLAVFVVMNKDVLQRQLRGQ